MNLKNFIDKINNLEKSVDISILEVFNFNPWPVIRQNIYTRYDEQFLINPNQFIRINLLTKINSFYLSLINYFKNPLKNEKVDILFLTRSSESLDIIENKKFNRYSDSFIHFFNNKYKIKVIETLDSYIKTTNYYNSNTSNIFIKTLPLRIKSIIINKFKHIYNIKKINNKIELEFNIKVSINRELIYINELRKFYEKILQSYSPKIVMLACYYRPDAMAMTLACKKHGIKVVEYQHGAQNNNHAMYSNWANIPQNGYELLPDIFWTWGNVSEERIKKWAENTNRHNAVIGGNLWLAYNKNQIINNNNVNIKFNKEKYNILVSLQGDERFPDYLIEYIETLGEDYSWYFRNHPRIPVSEKLQNKLNSLSDISVNEAMALDLYALLTNMDLHITGYSTVAFEAQSFGVPTIFTHINAKNGHQDLIGKNGLYFADSIEDFSNKVSFIQENKEEIKPDYIISDVTVAEKALEELMD